MEIIEKNEKLYKELLKEKDEKIAMLQKMKGLGIYPGLVIFYFGLLKVSARARFNAL